MDPIALPMSNFYGPRLDSFTNKIDFPILTGVTPDSLRAFILQGHFPSFKMKYNTTMARGFGINQELSQGVGGVFATVATHSGQKNRD
ncbi:hypothetical protein TNCV_2353591 [Trichonephila clavipes]|nr:hypothetical protein TNCV_2353591 [Trichonephila clavipes]